MKFQENTPIYVQIADDVKRQVIAGAVTPGDKLPSIREYSVQYAVTALTMQRALGLLESDGIVQTKKGVGSFVMEGTQEKLRQGMLAGQVKDFIAQLTHMGLTGDEIVQLVKEGVAHGR